MRIPTRPECMAFLYQGEVPAHIVAHSLRVAQVGAFMARHLNRIGEALRPDLVEAGALLHDLTKMRSLGTGANHAETAASALRALGYPVVAEVVRQHIFLDPRPPDQRVNEALVVFYADKRVLHDRVVGLKERFSDLMARYARTPDHRAILTRINHETERLEARIFQGLPFFPARLDELNSEPLPVADCTSENPR